MNNRIYARPLPFVLAALTVASCLSGAWAKGVRQRVQFARGHSSATIQQSVLRGETDRYLLRARAGQRLWVRISAVENNAAFHILKPGGKATLRGAGEMDDATRWSGKLPATGNYTIVVGGTRGNASYTLRVTLR